MSNLTRVAVIGLGGVAQLVHLPILSKLKDIKLVAVAEINKNRLNAVGDKFGITERFQDYKKMLDEVDIDAVFVCTPTSTHRTITIDCLQAQKHVFVEKPIARKYDEAKEINDAAKKCKRKVMVGMNQRFRPDAMLMKSIFTTNEFGELFYINGSWSMKQSSREKWILKKSESGGGVLLDLGIVLLDFSLWLLDYPTVTSVSAQHYSHHTKEVEDSAVAFIRCKNSAVINLEVSWTLYSEREKLGIAAYGTGGNAFLNPFRAYKQVEENYIDYTLSQVKGDKDIIRRSFENEIKNFIGAVKGLHPFLSTSDDAVIRMYVIEAIYKSAKEKSEIKLI
jgi:predicted dehydrogenase